MTKKPKIVISDEALKNIPPEKREAVKADILRMFEGCDPSRGVMPEGAHEIQPLPPGPLVCPTCKVDLRKETTLTLPAHKGEPEVTMDIFECPCCEGGFERVAAN